MCISDFTMLVRDMVPCRPFRADFHGSCELFTDDLPSPFSTVVVRVTRTLVLGTAYAMTRSIVRSGQWALLFPVLADCSSVWVN